MCEWRCLALDVPRSSGSPAEISPVVGNFDNSSFANAWIETSCATFDSGSADFWSCAFSAAALRINSSVAFNHAKPWQGTTCGLLHYRPSSRRGRTPGSLASSAFSPYGPLSVSVLAPPGYETGGRGLRATSSHQGVLIRNRMCMWCGRIQGAMIPRHKTEWSRSALPTLVGDAVGGRVWPAVGTTVIEASAPLTVMRS
jgi:hypothetical protein